MYQKVSTDMNFAQREEEVIKFWRDEDVFKKTVKLREGAPAFTFFDGPPTANGKPHIGHVDDARDQGHHPALSTMKGYDVLRKAGWDTHGLPVELEVEKMLGLDGKAADRGIRHRAVHQEVQGVRLEIQDRVGADERARRLLGGYGAPIYHLRG